MNKYEWKPLLLIIPFILCIAICGIFDFRKPSDNIQLALDNPQQVPNEIGTDVDKDEDEKLEEEDTTIEEDDPYPINPIKTKMNRDVPEDAEWLTIVIGLKGSMDQAKSGTQIYEDPNEESYVISKLQFHCIVVADERQYDENWVHVKLEGDYTEGYVKREDVYVTQIPIGDIDPVRDKIVKDAVSYLGLAFVQYGKSLETGIDCSNFIERIYNRNGIDIPNTPVKQRDAGIIIDNEMALPGDVVFYDKANDGYGHVGLYLGNGIIINSSGHSGKTYPVGGVRMCCLLYPDRDSFLMVDLINASAE